MTDFFASGDRCFATAPNVVYPCIASPGVYQAHGVCNSHRPSADHKTNTARWQHTFLLLRLLLLYHLAAAFSLKSARDTGVKFVLFLYRNNREGGEKRKRHTHTKTMTDPLANASTHSASSSSSVLSFEEDGNDTTTCDAGNEGPEEQRDEAKEIEKLVRRETRNVALSRSFFLLLVRAISDLVCSFVLSIS